MPYWMTNPDHGEMPVYSLTEVAQAQANGWTLLNQGESPNRPPKKGAEQVLKEALAESMQLDPPPSFPPAAADHVRELNGAPPKRKPGRPPKAK